METINLGAVLACSEAIILPLTADATGTWAFTTNFNSAYQYKQFEAINGQSITVPASLNENYTYSFKLYKPGGALFNDVLYTMHTMPMLPDVDYSCAQSESSELAQVTTGKKQFIAGDGQVEIFSNAFVHAKQLVVFVEGAARQEGEAEDEYSFDADAGNVHFNTPLIEGQKITILYFK